MVSKAHIRVLLVSFPAQGHINPMLRLAKHLASKGLSVTFSSTENTGKDLRAVNAVNETLPTPIGDGFLTFEFFDDGLANDDPKKKNLKEYIAQLEAVGKQVVSQMIKNHAEANNAISCIINNPFIPWVCDVATEHGIPCALLWVQSSVVFITYYHYFHKLLPFPSVTEPYIDAQLLTILLKYNEIPDFLHPFSPYPFLGTLILEQFKNLSKPFCILMDTFEELEHNYIKYLSNLFIIRPIGPLFRSPKPLLGGGNGIIRGDLVKTDDCMDWLGSRAPASVVYISFGSIVHLPQEQVDEIAHGLLISQVSFLWVLKEPHRDLAFESHVLPPGFLEKTSDRGKIVQWCPQEEVLAHPSVACFLTHCGWNSSMEAVALGVPVVTFPAWGDQVTNAKFLVDVYGIGIPLGYSQAENKITTRYEIKKCLLEATVGTRAEELKQNALKWKKAAKAAIDHGGSSLQNLDAFIEDIKQHRQDFSK
ncbi:hypothetical protein VNO77_31267 [Canavalia gladiata]|uniref:Glycosyltransferase n=1 Tax=Canavalia gladiata TaxID=3824 RepID=A0AAN9KSC2_CANGL